MQQRKSKPALPLREHKRQDSLQPQSPQSSTSALIQRFADAPKFKKAPGMSTLAAEINYHDRLLEYIKDKIADFHIEIAKANKLMSTNPEQAKKDFQDLISRLETFTQLVAQQIAAKENLKQHPDGRVRALYKEKYSHMEELTQLRQLKLAAEKRLHWYDYDSKEEKEKRAQHPLTPAADNRPLLVTDPAKMVPGTILLFYRTSAPMQQHIVDIQYLFSRQDEGDSEKTHAAIYVGNKNGKAMIAHVTEVNGIKGFRLEPLEEMEEREKCGKNGRPFQAFTPVNEQFAERIAQAAIAVSRASESEKPTWDFGKAFTMFLNRAKLITPGPDRNVVPSYTKKAVCSLFTMEMAAIGEQQTSVVDHRFKSDVLHTTNPTISPKGMDEALRHSKDFVRSCYTGRDGPFVHMLGQIRAILEACKIAADNAYFGAETAKKKYGAANAKFQELEKALHSQDFTDLDKTFALIKQMAPILKTLNAPESALPKGFLSKLRYRNCEQILYRVAKDAGIDRVDIETFDKPQPRAVAADARKAEIHLQEKKRQPAEPEPIEPTPQRRFRS